MAQKEPKINIDDYLVQSIGGGVISFQHSLDLPLNKTYNKTSEVNIG